MGQVRGTQKNMLERSPRLHLGAINRPLHIASCLAVGARFIASLLFVGFFLFSPDLLSHSSVGAAHSAHQFIASTQSKSNRSAIHISNSQSPTFQVHAGFNTRFKPGNWIPVQISLQNSGADFSGTLSVDLGEPVSALEPSPSSYQQPLMLPAGAQKQITMYVPANDDAPQIAVNLLDSHNHLVGTQMALLRSIGTGDILVGVLSDSSTGFGPLRLVSLPSLDGSPIVVPLDANTFPARTQALRNFDLLILDNFATATLSSAQLSTLQVWVDSGGTLLVVGGPEWRRTLGPASGGRSRALPADLLPVLINGTSRLPAGTRLLPVGSPTQGTSGQKPAPATISAPVTVSTATIPPGKADYQVVLVADKSAPTPLIVQARHGQGNIFYLAFDPTLEPILGWAGASALWKGILLRALGDQLLPPNNEPGTGQVVPSGMDNLLQALLPNTFFSPWVLLVLLLSYLLLIGPVRLLIVRRFKQRNWSWRIVLSSIVVFSLLSYGLSFYEKGNSVLINTISIVQLSQGGLSSSSAPLSHIVTYIGVFVPYSGNDEAPSQGDFHVHLSGDGLVQPTTNAFFAAESLMLQGGGFVNPDAGGQGQHATVTSGQDGKEGTTVNLQAVDIWTLRSMLSEQERQIHGGISSDLALQNGRLAGTVTNTLSYGLSDVYVLMNVGFVRLGHLAAGQSVHIDLPVGGTAPNQGAAHPGDGEAPFADQIAADNGVSAQLDSNSPPQSELQRRMAILSVLSGEGYYYSEPVCRGPCSLAEPLRWLGLFPQPFYSAVISLGRGRPFRGLPFTGSSDTLLMDGAPATLIGWAEHPIDESPAITVNGTSPGGMHETLVQVPLTVALPTAANLSAGAFAGQLIDIPPDLNVRIWGEDTYGLPGQVNKGEGLTFEFAVPWGSDQSGTLSGRQVSYAAQISSLTITEPSIGAVGPVNMGRIEAHLYNWQTNSWDAFAWNKATFAFTTNNPKVYLGANGRVLLQLADRNPAQGKLILTRPVLTLI